MKKNNAIFLLGAQRSGTTALAYSLDKAFADNNGIFTVNGKLPYYLNRWLTNEDLHYRHFRVDEIIYSLKRKLPGGIEIDNWLEHTEIVLNTYAKEVADGMHTDAKLLTKSIIDDCYKAYDYWGEKYNEYLIHFDFINHTLPEAKFILLYRDPISVAKSMSEWEGYRPWKPSSKEQIIHKWTKWHEKILKQILHLKKEKVLVVEYNRLCTNKETTRISDFLGLDIEKYLTNLQTTRKLNHDIRSLPVDTINTLKKLNEYANVGVI